MPLRKASKQDYIKIQGEEPLVELDPKTGLKTILYSDGTEIISHINHGAVNLGGGRI